MEEENIYEEVDQITKQEEEEEKREEEIKINKAKPDEI